ncbi:hypothetical protein PCASD_26191 [Puccinia coronata f. sp. avenae]|uniref:Uncharacterized protein n=1 Tax=Puccinia coronata f. sp. avenae TaxID=200324 RepID=A0A2N5RXM0_9BASI|nr:hypothetical protein PCASD_26191 [Puccinia coronata f. sp. avenae]
MSEKSNNAQLTRSNMALAKERSIPLALTPSSAFVKRENSLPLLASMSFEQLDTMKIDEPYNPHQGVAAFEIHLGAPSIACLERVLQPVPFPPRKTPTNYLAERATIEVPNRPRSQEATTTSMIAPEPTKPTTELQANSPLESQELLPTTFSQIRQLILLLISQEQYNHLR